MHKHKLLKWKYTNLRNDESKYLRTFLLTEYWNMKDKVENTDDNMLYLKILKTRNSFKESECTILPISC